jgi:hypothetical protein
MANVYMETEKLAKLLERAAARIREGGIRNLRLDLSRSVDKYKYDEKTGYSARIPNSGEVRFSMSFSDNASHWPAEDNGPTVTGTSLRELEPPKDG